MLIITLKANKNACRILFPNCPAESVRVPRNDAVLSGQRVSDGQVCEGQGGARTDTDIQSNSLN